MLSSGTLSSYKRHSSWPHGAGSLFHMDLAPLRGKQSFQGFPSMFDRRILTQRNIPHRTICEKCFLIPPRRIGSRHRQNTYIALDGKVPWKRCQTRPCFLENKADDVWPLQINEAAATLEEHMHPGVTIANSFCAGFNSSAESSQDELQKPSLSLRPVHLSQTV